MSRSRIAHPDGETWRVFIVDDHRYLRKMVATFLSTIEGVEVCGMAKSGAEALERIPSTDCHLALIDVAMPNMSGIELVGHLRERHPEVKCLMLSGHVVESYMVEALRAGASGYVAKGDPDALLTAIDAVVHGGQYVTPPSRPAS